MSRKGLRFLRGCETFKLKRPLSFTMNLSCDFIRLRSLRRNSGEEEMAAPLQHRIQTRLLLRRFGILLCETLLLLVAQQVGDPVLQLLGVLGSLLRGRLRDESLRCRQLELAHIRT